LLPSKNDRLSEVAIAYMPMLKNISQIAHTRHRSLDNFLVNLIASLIAYTHQDKKPSLNLSTNKLDLLPTFSLGSSRQAMSESRFWAKSATSIVASFSPNDLVKLICLMQRSLSAQIGRQQSKDFCGRDQIFDCYSFISPGVCCTR
jgi:hypothetical protein